MLTNRHLVVALLVAPVLSLLAWYGVGQIAGDKPAPAEPGAAYPLVEQPNCRYASGACDLKNVDLKLRIVVGDGPSPELTLSSSHMLERVQLALAAPSADGQPSELETVGANGREWRLRLAVPPTAKERIRLVAQASGSLYYGDVATAFVAGITH